MIAKLIKRIRNFHTSDFWYSGKRQMKECPKCKSMEILPRLVTILQNIVRIVDINMISIVGLKT